MSGTPRISIGESTDYRCAWCGESGELMVDPSAGRRQTLVEDCWVCCRPNLLTLVIDGSTARVTAEREG